MSAPVKSDTFVKLLNVLSICPQLNNDNLQSLLNYVTQSLIEVKRITEALKDSHERENIDRLILTDLCQVTSGCSTVFDTQPQLVDLTTECFRSLRNACAGCEANQKCIVQETNILESTEAILTKGLATLGNKELSAQTEPVLTLLRCAVQFVGNSCAGMPANQRLVDSKLAHLFRRLLSTSDPRLGDYVSMVVHVCGCARLDSPRGVDTAVAVVRLLTHHDSQWGMFVLERLLSSSLSIAPLYSYLEDSHRLFLLETILVKLGLLEELSGDEKPVSAPTMEFLADEFVVQAHSVLGLIKQDNSFASVTVTKLLEVLCAATSVHGVYQNVQDNEKLVKTTVELLHCIHMVGQQGDNEFSPLTKASESQHVDGRHPAVGLKRDLVRLIANLAHHHKHNQDKVRFEGGIHLIMDHTNIDARNPFMMQWAIFALHNLCENNAENQAIIAGMRLEGVADNVEKLKDFGVCAEMDGDKIVIKNVDGAVKPSPFSKDEQS